MWLILFPVQSFQHSNYFSVHNFQNPIFAYDLPWFCVLLFFLRRVFVMGVFHTRVCNRLLFRMPTYTSPAPSRIPNPCILLLTRHLHLDTLCPKWTSPSSSTNLLVLLYFLCISAGRSPLTHLSKTGICASVSLTLPHHVLYGSTNFLHGYILSSLCPSVLSLF